MSPINIPIGGMMTSFTIDLTIVPNAPPIMIPTAMSITLPLTAKSLNSLIMPMGLSYLFVLGGIHAAGNSDSPLPSAQLTGDGAVEGVNVRGKTNAWAWSPFKRHFEGLRQGKIVSIPAVKLVRFVQDSVVCGAIRWELEAPGTLLAGCWGAPAGMKVLAPWTRGFPTGPLPRPLSASHAFRPLRAF